jgi:hypothetical protein
MSVVHELEQQRDQVLEQLRKIDSMKRGTLNTQYFDVLRNGKKTSKKRGPYYVFSRKEGKKTVSKRLRSKAEVQQAREDIAEHRHFVELCKQLEQITEQLGELKRQKPDIELEKKRRKSPSSRTGK